MEHTFEIGQYVFGVLVLFLAILLAWGWLVVRQNTAAVRERLGRFNAVLLPGLRFLWFPGIIDRLTVSKTGKNRVLIQQRIGIDVFAKEGGKIDYSDDSAVTRATLWVTVGNTEWDIDDKGLYGGRDKIRGAVKKYVYAAEDSKERARSLVDEALRSELQKLTVDEALKEKAAIAAKVGGSEGIRAQLTKDLEPIGLYLLPEGEDVVTIGDIVLSEKSEELRRRVLEERKGAEAREHAARGTRRALEIISKGERGGTGEEIPIMEAADFQMRLQGLEVAKAAGTAGKVSLINNSISAIVDSLVSGTLNKP